MAYFESKDKVKSDNLKTFLENNKIYFETLATLLLSLMAILVSMVQTQSGYQQTELAKLQTQISEQQWEMEQRSIKIQRTADWQRLRDAIWRILDLSPPMGIKDFDKMSIQDKADWFLKVRALLVIGEHNMANCSICCRVSTDKQAEQGYSLEVQRTEV